MNIPAEKILFLDVDGVLNSEIWNKTHVSQISNGLLIDEEKVKLLSFIISNTDAKIVLESGWRFWFDQNKKPLNQEAEYFLKLFEKYNLTIYGCTPDFSDGEIKITKMFSRVKAREILAWIDHYPKQIHWLVIEDMDLSNDLVKQHQIQTDTMIGLTEEQAQEAIAYLNQ